MPARVLYVISSLEQGGAERQLAELVRGLDRSRFEPRIALCDATDRLGYELDAGRYYDLDSANGSTPRTLVKLVRVLRDARPELVHGFGGLVSIYSRLAVRMTGIGRAIGAVRNGRPPLRDLVYEGLTAPLASAFIVNSVGIREQLVRVSRIPARRIDVIENGVDLARFRPRAPATRAALRERWELRGPTLVLVGRVGPEKNHEGLLRALARLERDGALPPDATVLFAGKATPPSHGDALRALVRELGLDRRVRFLGSVLEVEDLVAAADGLVLPSHYEGIPNAVLEAFASGVPAIVSPPANLDSIVTDGREGFAAESTEPGDLARALRRFFALSAEELTAMGARARATAEARFSIPKMVERTSAVYDRVLARG